MAIKDPNVYNIIGDIKRREDVYKPHHFSLFIFRLNNDHDASWQVHKIAECHAEIHLTI
jgi:hypothetical protein